MAKFYPHIPLLDHFSDLPDPRYAPKVTYSFDELLLVLLCGTFAGEEDFVDIAVWASYNLDYLRRLRPFEHGTPSHDTLNSFANSLDAEAFEHCFRAWVASLGQKLGAGPEQCEQIAIDGKTLRGTTKSVNKVSGLHLVSAWACKARLSLGCQAIDRTQENEIIGVHRLLDWLQLDGALVSLDAMGCQRAIADKIVTKGGDYLLALKGNQGGLYEDVKLWFDEQCQAQEPQFSETCGDHGRIEERRLWLCQHIEWLQERHNWPRLAAFGCIEKRLEYKNRPDKPASVSKRYFLVSKVMTPKAFADAVRTHWAIENNQHWVLDVSFGEDAQQLKDWNGAQIMSAIRKITMALLKPIKGKMSYKTARKTVSWSFGQLERVLKQKQLAQL